MRHFFILFALFFTSQAFSADLRGRLGMGATNQLANEIPAISLKLQQTKTFAIGGLLGFKSDQDNTLYGAGVKFYRIIFDEPQLTFYLAGLFATETFLDETKDKVKSGHQIDGTFGTEFHFQGLESLGFSFEFGLSARNASEKGSTFQTLGDQFLKAAFHFYL